MSSATTGKSATLGRSPSATRSNGEFFLSPWFCGPVLTVGFYVLLSQLPPQAESIKRYFDGHWILYAETGLFFVGVAVLLRKALGLVLDHRALRLILIDADSLAGIDSPRDRALELLGSSWCRHPSAAVAGPNPGRLCYCRHRFRRQSGGPPAIPGRSRRRNADRKLRLVRTILASSRSGSAGPGARHRRGHAYVNPQTG